MRKSRASYDDTTLVDSNYGDAPLLDKDKKGKKDKKEVGEGVGCRFVVVEVWFCCGYVVVVVVLID